MEAAKELTVKGYRQAGYGEIQLRLFDKFKESKKSYVELAYELDVRSVSTAQNILTSDTQIVSDELLSKVINLLGINAFVIWVNGERNYYIKN